MIACRTPPPPEPPAERLWIAGDVYLAGDRDVLDAALAERLGGVGFVNLEGPVGPAPGAVITADRVTLVHDADALAALRGAGVGVAGIANNHAGDAGSDGPNATAAALAAHGIDAAGDGRVPVRRVAGRDTAFVALDVPSDGAITLPALPAHDRLVVALHVTGPASPEPVPALVAAVDVALAAGADVIAAHGTHAWGPVERRGDAIVAWGLGNLAFDCACTNGRDALVLVVEPDGAAAVVPIAAGLGGAPARPAADAGGLLDALDALSPAALRRDGDVGRF